jgi:hypothetical protein
LKLSRTTRIWQDKREEKNSFGYREGHPSGGDKGGAGVEDMRIMQNME